MRITQVRDDGKVNTMRTLKIERLVEQMKKEEGLTKADVGREGFLKRAWAWEEKYGKNIIKKKYRRYFRLLFLSGKTE